MQQSEKNKYPTLKVIMKDCCCYTCGPGSVETIEKESDDDYTKYIWNSINDYDDAKHYENVAWTLNRSLVGNDGDGETSTKEEYEEFKKDEMELN